MRKFLVWPDGHRYELSPLTCNEFVATEKWVGGSDISFQQFLHINNFHELDAFDEGQIKKCKWNGKGWELEVKLIIEPGEPTIDWTLHYGAMSLENGKWVDDYCKDEEG